MSLALTVVFMATSSRHSSSYRSRILRTLVISWCTAIVSSLSSSTGSARQKKNSWFPTRIQDSFQYDKVVERLYVRHIVTETEEMANTVVKMYFESLVDDSKINDDSSDDDPFATLARQVSMCEASRPEGGKIGWVDRKTDWQLFPVAAEFFLKQPKAGDIHVLLNVDSQQWHVVQCVEAWINFDDSFLSIAHEEESTRTGTFGGSNAVFPQRTLKGKGVSPRFPSQLQSYHIQTAGCQMNVADSERLEGLLKGSLGLKVAARPQDADLVLLNTCSIRDHAEQKLYDILGPYAARKRQGHSIAIIVTGCVAQQEGEALLQRVPEIDVVLGPQYVPFLPNVLEKVACGEQLVVTAPVILPEQQQKETAWNPYPPVRGHSVRAWVNVIHGCNEHCTYCVVPSTRGMEVSRTMEAILTECNELAERGYREVTLLGQNIDAYGRDMVPKRNFAQLLEFLDARLPDGFRIRYVTSHPRYFSDRVIDAISKLDKVCECFHMPFQAGDNEVLARMRRGYTFDSYIRIIEKIRSQAPDAAICADVIVGFPGETEAAFQKTLELMEKVKFDNINSFAYSPRPNTEASLWPDQVDEEIKSERLQRVQKLALAHGQERSDRYLGRTEEVLVEDANPRNNMQVMGRTRQGRQVYFPGSLDDLKGRLVRVVITEARAWSLRGKMTASS